MNLYELDETQSAFRERDAVPPHQDWSPLEQWIWSELQAGQIADLARYPDAPDPSAFDPTGVDPERDGWRRVSARFLEMVLLENPWRSAVHRRGVRIVGAWFADQIDLRDAELIRPLWLHRCRVSADLSLTDATCRLLSLIGSRVEGTLGLERADVGQNLFMHGGASFQEINARGLKVGGQLTLLGSRIEGALSLEGADIGQSLFMRRATLARPVNAAFAHVGGNLDLRGATLATLDLTGATIDGELRMAGRAACSFQDNADLNLRNARVGAVQDSEEAWPAKIELDGFTYGRFGGFGAGLEGTSPSAGRTGSSSG